MATTKKTMSTKKRTGSAFSEDERRAMKEYSEEKKRQRSRGGKTTKEDGAKDIEAAIAKMPDEDAAVARKVHAIVTEAVPELEQRTWYGMPAYAKDGDVICFFQNAGKFKARYSTLGFSDKAQLDKGSIWPTSYAVTEVNGTVEKEIRALVKRAIG